jgi:Tfp pilus assembly protein PilF
VKETSWEKLAVLTMKADDMENKRKDLKRAVKKLKATQEKQLKSGHLDEAKDRLKDVTM